MSSSIFQLHIDSEQDRKVRTVLHLTCVDMTRSISISKQHKDICHKCIGTFIVGDPAESDVMMHVQFLTGKALAKADGEKSSKDDNGYIQVQSDKGNPFVRTVIWASNDDIDEIWRSFLHRDLGFRLELSYEAPPYSNVIGGTDLHVPPAGKTAALDSVFLEWTCEKRPGKECAYA